MSGLTLLRKGGVEMTTRVNPYGHKKNIYIYISRKMTIVTPG